MNQVLKKPTKTLYTSYDQKNYQKFSKAIPFENRQNRAFFPYKVGHKVEKVLLINIGKTHRDHFLVTPPLGIMYLSSFIKHHRADIEVKLVDQKIGNIPSSDLAQLAVDFSPDLIGLSVISPNAVHFPEAIDALKAVLPEVPLVVGGAHVSAEEIEIFEQSCADFGCTAEGEETLLRLIDAIEASDRGLRDPFAYEHLSDDPLYDAFSNIAGLQFISGTSLIHQPMSPKIADLDSIPFPDWAGIDVEAYSREFTMTPVGKRRYMALYTSRGCPYKCNYCHEQFGKTFRARSPQNVVDEIELLVEKYNIDNFEIVDDIFNFSRRRTIEICEEIISRNLKVRFSFPNGLRADLLTNEVIDALHAAGAYFISFAIETATPALQKKIGKFMDLDKLRESVNYAGDKGIFCNGFFMLGFPGETKEQIVNTIDFATNLRLHTASFFIVTPFKGTTLYHSLEDEPDKRDIDFTNVEDYNYIFSDVNLTSLPNKELYALQRRANRSFYLRPGRIFRILKDMPYRSMLFTAFGMLLRRLFSGRSREK